MLRELLNILRSGEPLPPLGDSFMKMLELASDLTVRAGKMYFLETTDAQELLEVRRQDTKVNKLQRKIRKGVVTHLSASTKTPDLPYCLLLMSLVKDVERIGDYAKELSVIPQFAAPSFSDHEIVQELRLIRVGVEEMVTDLQNVLSTDDNEQAVKMIRHGRGLIDRGDGLLRALAVQPFDPSTHTALVLGTQYYRRLCGHALNVLSSVVVPLHKLDYYDEDDIAVARTTS
jgi:phosphate transport system protein